MASASDWRNPQQTYTNAKKDVADKGDRWGGFDNDRKNRKAAQLQSNVLTHEDANFKAEREQYADYTAASKISGTASNADWSNNTLMQKPINAGGQDAYRAR